MQIMFLFTFFFFLLNNFIYFCNVLHSIPIFTMPECPPPSLQTFQICWGLLSQTTWGSMLGKISKHNKKVTQFKSVLFAKHHPFSLLIGGKHVAFF